MWLCLRARDLFQRHRDGPLQPCCALQASAARRLSYLLLIVIRRFSRIRCILLRLQLGLRVLTCRLQLSLSQPQVDCITAYIRGSSAAHSPMASPSASQWSPLAQRSSINQPISCSPTAPAAVPSDDEDLVTELVSLLARAGLAPPSSRRPVAAMLCAAGVGSAEALLLALDRDPLFLSNQVHF